MHVIDNAAFFSVTCGPYVLNCTPKGLPSLFEEYCKHSTLTDLVEPFDSFQGDLCSVAVSRDGEWPILVVAQKYNGAEGCFLPGVLISLETNVMFLGAGERLLAYDLVKPKRLWEERVEYGFLRWNCYGDVILMSSELELAAWDTRGEKLWTALDCVFVEPPWSYQVSDGVVRLDVMGKIHEFPLAEGPKKAN